MPREKLLKALVQIESGGDPNAVSSKGAIGTHQVMPIAARDVMRAEGIDDSQFTNAQIREILKRPGMSQYFGERYLGLLLKRFSGNERLAMAAYNGGPTRLEEKGLEVSKMPLETQKYVKLIAEKLRA